MLACHISLLLRDVPLKSRLYIFTVLFCVKMVSRRCGALPVPVTCGAHFAWSASAVPVTIVSKNNLSLTLVTLQERRYLLSFYD
jgi:hypothetical protein